MSLMEFSYGDIMTVKSRRKRASNENNKIGKLNLVGPTMTLYMLS